ncbi:MAG: tetratricopeptide repeat protein [Flavobacteriales bacterium]|jgi:class 3 adenylate cyclase/Flp pilus assembly protein TadD|nr:tetratricopeptide repeat protein [Flavobacteriales bacterium]
MNIRTIGLLINAFLQLEYPCLSRANIDSLRVVWQDVSFHDTSRFDAGLRLLKVTGAIQNGDPDSALSVLRELLVLSRSAEDQVREGRALSTMGRLRYQIGEPDTAIRFMEHAYLLFVKQGALKDQVAVLNSVAQVYSEKGDLANAIDRLSKALRIVEAERDSSLIARIRGNMGIMYYLGGDTANAMLNYKARLVIAERIGQKDILCEVLNNMALIHVESGDTALALAEYGRGLEIARGIGYKAMIINCLHNIGDIESAKGLYASARSRLHESLGLAREMDSPEHISELLISLAWTYIDANEHSKALPLAQEAMKMAMGAGLLVNKGDAAEVLFMVHKRLGNYSEALAMHETMVASRESVASEENKGKLMQQRFQYDFDKKEALLAAEQEKKDALAAEEMRRKDMQRNAFIGGFVLMLALAGTFLFQRNRINKEKRRSEELLLNILPEEVALELKAKGEADAKQIDHVTVLFTDFKGFTAMSEQLSPKELVRDIHECFSAFDRIMQKHGIEKIKTIGDAYMAAGGLPTPNTTHAPDVVKAALEIRDFIAEGKTRKVAAGLPYFEIRIGIHTGPVVAGIVGVKKFQYDIWGDTVNTASRMESSGAVGQVNISEATYALVKNEPGLMFTSRGKVQAKGKGEMEMYFVESRMDSHI